MTGGGDDPGADADAGLERATKRLMAALVAEASPAAQPSLIARSADWALDAAAFDAAVLAAGRLNDLSLIREQFIDPATHAGLDDPDAPIIVGPWLMEVGFELLYWIPFLRRELRARGIPPSRVIAVSRGGVADWYRDIADRYVDVFDLTDADTFRDFHAARDADGRKLATAHPFEAELVAAAARELGLSGNGHLYPSYMYGLFRNLWRSRAGGEALAGRLTHELIDMAGATRPEGLPDGAYAAVKLYRSACFGQQAADLAFGRELITRLAQKGPVVLLNLPEALDDHGDLLANVPSNVIDFSGRLSPRDNLDVQTRVVANASALYTNYGGFSYLGPLIGTPTVALLGDGPVISTHLSLAVQAYGALGGGSFNVVKAEPSAFGLLGL